MRTNSIYFLLLAIAIFVHQSVCAQIDFSGTKMSVDDVYSSSYYKGYITDTKGVIHAISPVSISVDLNIKIDDGYTLKAIRLSDSNGKIILNRGGEVNQVLTTNLADIGKDMAFTVEADLEWTDEKGQLTSIAKKYDLPTKIHLWEQPVFPEISGGADLRLRDVDEANVKVNISKGTGAVSDGWIYYWQTPSGNEYSLVLNLNHNDINISSLAPQKNELKYTFYFENRVPNAGTLLSGEIPYSVCVYNTPPVPSEFIRKGRDGVSVSGICIVKMDNYDQEYNYSYGSFNGTIITELEKSTERYTTAFCQGWYPSCWVRTYWEYSDGTVVYSNLRMIDGSEYSPADRTESNLYFINDPASRVTDEYGLTGIEQAQYDEIETIVGIYDVRGIRHERLAKGLNIVSVKTKSGILSTKKIYVK